MPEVTTSIAEDVKAPVEKSPITQEQFAIQRGAVLTARSLPPKEEKAPEKTEVEAEPEAKTEEAKPVSQESAVESKEEAKGKDVLSQVNLSELTDEDIAELAQKGKSGLLKRVAELTVKRKLAEEKAAQLEQVIAQHAQAPATLVEAKVENNPYANLDSAEAVNAKYAEVTEVIEWAEDVLERADGLSSTDVAAQVDGRDLTKAEIREHLRKARKAHDKYLPAQLNELNGRERQKGLRQAFENQARKELSWLEGEDNDVRKNYQAMINDPRLKKLEAALPDIAAQLPYILAHAANSIHGRKSLTLDAAPAKTTPKINPPPNPNTSASGSERSDTKDEVSVKDASKRLRESGKMDDFIALRTAQISKRKTIK